MNKDNEKELVKLLQNMFDNFRTIVENQRKSTRLTDKIIGLIEFLIKSTKIIFFVLGLLIWRVFFLDSFNVLLDRTTEKWLLLTEGYKILFLGFIGTIIAGIIAQIVGSLLLEKFKNILKK